MENYINVQSIDTLKQFQNIDGQACQIPLFHGTRRYALQATKEEREKFYSACHIVMDFAKKLYECNEIDEKLVKEYRVRHNPEFLDGLVHSKDKKLFSYGNFYLTTSYSRAINFSHKVGGELGNAAYAQCLGLIYFGIPLDETVKYAVKIILEEHKKYLDSEKIIVIFLGIKFHDMSTEGGEPFLISTTHPQSQELNCFRIKNLYKSIETDTSKHAPNYRLTNVDSYTGYIIGEKDFRAGFSIFTKINDIEKTIKSNPNWNF